MDQAIDLHVSATQTPGVQATVSMTIHVVGLPEDAAKLAQAATAAFYALGFRMPDGPVAVVEAPSASGAAS